MITGNKKGGHYMTWIWLVVRATAGRLGQFGQVSLFQTSYFFIIEGATIGTFHFIRYLDSLNHRIWVLPTA